MASMGHGDRRRCSLRQLTSMAPVRCLLNLGPPQVTSGTILHCDAAMTTCMHRRCGLCMSGHEKDDTVSPSDADVGDTELRHALHVGLEVIVTMGRLDCTSLQSWALLP